MLLLARFGRRGGFHDLVNRGPDPTHLDGPRLAEVPYPDVLVARAASDGTALELVLRPGAGGGRCSLQLDGLRSGARYRARGAVAPSFDADESGRAVVQVDLSDRLEVRVAPAE